MKAARSLALVAHAYDLAATLDSGQAFRWCHVPPSQAVARDAGGDVAESRDGGCGSGVGSWEGIIAHRWVRLRQTGRTITADVVVDPGNWNWLRDYLRFDDDLDAILATFPPDELLGRAVTTCRGLRLLKQDPWECLVSFLLSSTKQIVQIRQIIERLCARFGSPIEAAPDAFLGAAPRAFPSAPVLARATEAELRRCRMGFRAPYVLAAARAVASGELNLAGLADRGPAAARDRLMQLDGVGRKIADCVLLFGYGLASVFPVDVWVMRALKELYFRDGQPAPAVLRTFSETHFGPFGGYAQQYLFHYMRWRAGRVAIAPGGLAEWAQHEG